MATQPPDPNLVYAFLKQFDMGINSDVSPLLLPRNQLAFATDATMRGDFVRQRPNFFNMTLVDKTSGNFQNGLFQGACYYQTKDGNIMCMVGGQLYQLTASGTSSLVVNRVQFPDAGNVASATQNWMWQAERWLIVNDGTNLPLFYDGTTAKRSIGPRSIGQQLQQIGSILQALPVPPLGQSVTIQVSPNIPNTFVGLAVLLGNMQFTLQSLSSSSTQQSINLNTNVIGSTAGDALLSQNSGNSFVGANLFQNNQYLSTIAGITQNGQSITDWGNVLPPAPNGTINITTASGMTVDAAIANESNTEVECYGNPALPQAYAYKIGDPISLNGNDCIVTALTHGTLNTAGNVTGLTIQPIKNYAGQVLNDNSVDTEAAYTLALRFFIKSAFFEKATVTTKTGLPQKPPNGSTVPTLLPSFTVQSTSSGLFTWESLNNQNVFSVALNQAPMGLNTTTQYTFKAFPSAGSASTTGVTFTGFWGGPSNPLSLINCVIANPPPTGNPVWLVAGNATNVNQYVQVIQAAGVNWVPHLTTVGQVYNVTNSSTTPPTFGNLNVPAAGNSLTIPIQQTNNIVAGNLLFATATNGNLDIFVATGSSLVAATSGSWAVLVNETGTAGATIPVNTPIQPLPQLPVSTIGVYGLGRNWVTLPNGSSFIGGDLVGGASGSLPYDFDDAVLYVSQNLFLAGGTTFKIPSSGETISAMQFVASLDASLGQGPLQVFTNDTVFSCNAPPDAATWANVTNPILTESLIGSGGISDDAVTQANADLLFRTPDSNVQSMLLARLDYNEWGNTPVSREISRIIANDNQALLKYSSSVTFNNRYILACNPVQTSRGVVHQALAVMNFDPKSSLQGKDPSIWEGQWTGLNVLKLVTGFFSGVKRCFAICLDAATLSKIEVHEILLDTEATTDDLATDVTWSIESPMLFKNPLKEDHDYKRLADGEIYLDQITPAGVVVSAFYKADQNNVWTPWWTTTVAYQSNDTGFRPRVALGEPDDAAADLTNDRPLREGYDFQVKLQFIGSCRFLGGRFAANLIPQPAFAQPLP